MELYNISIFEIPLYHFTCITRVIHKCAFYLRWYILSANTRCALLLRKREFFPSVVLRPSPASCGGKIERNRARYTKCYRVYRVHDRPGVTGSAVAGNCDIRATSNSGWAKTWRARSALNHDEHILHRAFSRRRKRASTRRACN
jgi:hypothetical protein